MSLLMKQIEKQMDHLNWLTGNSKNAWNKINGKIVANIGHYQVTPCHNGYKMQQVANDNGGVYTIFVVSTKKKLFDQIQVYTNKYLKGGSNNGQ